MLDNSKNKLMRSNLQGDQTKDICQEHKRRPENKHYIYRIKINGLKERQRILDENEMSSMALSFGY